MNDVAVTSVRNIRVFGRWFTIRTKRTVITYS